MDYTSTIIRGMTDASFGRRPLVIADDSKMDGGASVHTLKTTARELGLDHHTIKAMGEDGCLTDFFIAGLDWAEVRLAAGMIFATTRMSFTGYERDAFQRDMGELLGYSEEDIDSFVGSDIAQSCACACCGGKAQ
jgi:hypothetical protein